MFVEVVVNWASSTLYAILLVKLLNVLPLLNVLLLVVVRIRSLISRKEGMGGPDEQRPGYCWEQKVPSGHAEQGAPRLYISVVMTFPAGP